MPFECIEFKQSYEKGASLSMGDACVRCGKTKAAHETSPEFVEPLVPSDQVAVEWLNRAGYAGQPYFELVRVVLTRYIEDQRQ